MTMGLYLDYTALASETGRILVLTEKLFVGNELSHKFISTVLLYSLKKLRFASLPLPYAADLHGIRACAKNY